MGRHRGVMGTLISECAELRVKAQDGDFSRVHLGPNIGGKGSSGKRPSMGGLPVMKEDWGGRS